MTDFKHIGHAEDILATAFNVIAAEYDKQTLATALLLSLLRTALNQRDPHGWVDALAARLHAELPQHESPNTH